MIGEDFGNRFADTHGCAGHRNDLSSELHLA
jgi:hypothetical protein